MSQHMIVRLLLTASILLLASSVFAVPPDELQPPVFVDCPGSVRATHCDDSIVRQFRAIIPNQPHAQGRVRYRLVGGCGTIDEKSGRWVWYPEPADTARAYDVTVAAYINNTNLETTPENYCRVWTWYRDNFGKLIWLQPPLSDYGYVPVYRVDAPGLTILPYRISEPDSCDHPVVSVFQIDPEPAGSITFIDSSLVVTLLPADNGKKFVVTYELTSGPFTYHGTVVIDTRPPFVPQFTNCPETLYASVGSQIRYQLHAVDPEYPELSAGIYYKLVSSDYSRPGSYRDGVFWFRARPEDAGREFEFELAAVYGDASTTGDQNCRFWVKVIENSPPEFVNSPCDVVQVAHADSPLEFSTTVTAIDPDSGDVVPRLFVQEVNPTPLNGYLFDPGTGRFQMTIHQSELGTQFSITIGASDLVDTAYCTFGYLHDYDALISLSIGHSFGAPQGFHERIDITATENAMALWGFDVLIGYNAAVLSFQTAIPGEIYDECAWEYFTYRYGASGNCNGRCPSGMLRIVGIAETNNGSAHPSCFAADAPFTLATLDFLISDDSTYKCTWQPIRFWWIDCGDNLFSYHDDWDVNPYGQSLATSRYVYDIDSTNEHRPFFLLPDGGEPFPRTTGVPDSCLIDDFHPQSRPLRLVNFYNGGIDIACSDSVDRCQAGDLNLNGTQCEIADVVLYVDGLLYGPRILTDSVCQMKASDANKDGFEWSLEDLVYLTYFVVGHPLPPVSPDTPSAHFLVSGSTIRVDPEVPLGAIYIIFDGSVVPTMNVAREHMAYSYDQNADLTRCLISALSAGESIHAGDLMTLDHPAAIRELSAVTDSGASVNEILLVPTGIDDPEPPLPASFFLYQNHPNPFNLETVIPFDLPQSGEVTLEIFNALGQSVHRRTAAYPAGNHQFTWNGHTDNGAVASSGIYYYRVSSNDHTRTRKMVLLK